MLLSLFQLTFIYDKKTDELCMLDEFVCFGLFQFTERALAHELLSPMGGPTSAYHISYARMKLQKKEYADAETSLDEALQFDYQVSSRRSYIYYTVDGLNFVGYQFSWFLWRVLSMNSSTHKMVIFCINYERKYFGHEF